MNSVFLYMVLLWGTVQACPSEDWDVFDGNCYRYYPDDSKTWIQAEGDCTGQGAHLTSVASEAEAYYIHAQMIAHNTQSDLESYWIGLLRQGSGNDFAWMDGSDYDYKRWAPGEPSHGSDQNCGVVFGDNRPSEESFWDDIECGKSRSFLCKVPEGNWKNGKDDAVKKHPSLNYLVDVVGQTSEESTGSGGLSTGATVGIVLAGLVAFVCVGTIVFMIMYRRRKMAPQTPPVKSVEMADNHI